MASQKFTLYDIPSKDKGCACWSLNPWKSEPTIRRYTVRGPHY